MRRKIVIMGAAGRDFHVFNTCYRDDDGAEVVAFTAAQIPHIEERRYPPELAGPHYPDGIVIRPERELESLIRQCQVDEVVFAYSDVRLEYLDGWRRRVTALGAAFAPFDPDLTMLQSSKPVIAVTATRTGCGKSQTTRRIAALLTSAGRRPVVIRHPMPYGDLASQEVQRFARFEDLASCTIEEREEYEPHLRLGVTVFAGVDYAKILEQAEREADVILWDGGNNDTPFYRPTLWITVADPHRAGDELDYFPGRINFERADLILINKVATAPPEGIATIEANAQAMNPGATVVYAHSPLVVSDPQAIAGRRVLAIEDGPTTTHGGMRSGAGTLAARQHGASELVDPRPWAVGEIASAFETYPDTGPLLPAMGYGEQQIRDLEATVNAVDCDLVLVASPVDLTRLIRIDKPCMRVDYELAEQGEDLARAVMSAL